MQLNLLGLSPTSRVMLGGYRRSEAIATTDQLGDRLGWLLAIHKVLRLLYSDNDSQSYGWVKLRHSALMLLGLALLITACSGGTSNNTDSGGNTVTPTTYVLTVTRTGTGTITSSPSGITCGNTCSSGYADNIDVTLTAIPGSGYTFSDWSGACSGTTATCVLPMTAYLSVTATFAAEVPFIGTATVSWTVPTIREDGSPLAKNELAGYGIYYGTSASNTNIVVYIQGGSTTEYTITGLAPGTYYFAVSAYDTSGFEGPKSSVVSKEIL